jgi:hypothetical protein
MEALGRPLVGKLGSDVIDKKDVVMLAVTWLERQIYAFQEDIELEISYDESPKRCETLDHEMYKPGPAVIYLISLETRKRGCVESFGDSGAMLLN